MRVTFAVHHGQISFHLKTPLDKESQKAKPVLAFNILPYRIEENPIVGHRTVKGIHSPSADPKKVFPLIIPVLIFFCNRLRLNLEI